MTSAMAYLYHEDPKAIVDRAIEALKTRLIDEMPND